MPKNLSGLEREMRQFRIGPLLFMLLLFLFVSSPAAPGENTYDAGTVEKLKKAETADVIIQKVIEAYGGKKTIENITSVYTEGRIKAVAFNDEGSYVRYFKRGRKLKVDIEYSRSSERRILDGRKAYESIDMAPFSETAGASYLAIVYQYKQLDLPHELLTGAFSLHYEGKRDLNGIETAVLDLNDNEGPPMKIYVSMKDFHIIKVSGSFSMGGNAMDLSSEASDFRKVDGTVLPFKITNYAGGQLIAETSIRKYKINPKLSDSLFSPVRGPAEAGAP